MKKILSVLLMVGIFAFNFNFFAPQVAMAASLTAMSDTISNSTASATASHVIKFTTPTGIPASKTIVLTFNNSTSTTGVTASDVTVLDGASAITVNAGAPTTTNWGFVNASPVITFTTGTGTIAAGHIITITFNGTNKITNGAAGTTTLTINGSMADSGVLSMAIVANGIVSVSANVIGSISFTVSSNAIYFGNLRTGGPCFAQGTDPGAVTCPTTTETEAFNMTAGTNAPSGYAISVQGDTLTSSGASHSITALASNTASSPGSEQFGIRFNAAGGSGTVTAPYAAAGYAYTATSSTAAQVASYTGPSATTTYSGRYLANIGALTPAGSYSTAHTYVATANF